MTHFAYRLAPHADTRAWGAQALYGPLVPPARVARGGLLPAAGITGWKRILDIALSGIALALVSPIMAAAALAIKAGSPGPVFFRQERIGLNRRRRRGDRREAHVASSHERRVSDRRVIVNPGKPFMMYKFRTMVVDAERGQPVWAQKADPRITPVGRFLRKTRIDELPQFFNVLRGDMSIVGPRPERAYFIKRIEKDLPDFQLRLRAKPGITGLAQVELGYTNTDDGLRHKLAFDLEYIRRLTPLTDFRILCKTIFVVLTGKGAH